MILLATLPLTAVLAIASPGLPPENDMSTQTTSPQPAASPPDRPEAKSFNLSFRSAVGVQVSKELQSWTTVTLVRGPSRAASMVITRHNNDLIGRPIGLFSGTLTTDAVERLTSAINNVKWSELPQPEKGDVTAPMLTLDYSGDGKLIQRSFSARSLEFIRAIGPVIHELNETSSWLLAHPDRAIDVQVERTPEADPPVFRLIIRNIGKGPIALADPRAPTRLQGQARAFIRIADAPINTAGVTEIPPNFSPVALEPLPAGANPDAPKILHQGERLVVSSVAWPRPDRGGEFLAQAVFEDYSGSAAQPEGGTLDAIPDPESISAAKPYVVRGAAFSSYLRFRLDARKAK